MDKPLLHLVFGGTVSDPQGTDFIDPDDLDIIGIFPNNNSATKAWRSTSQTRVDEANVKYVIVHLHRMPDPDHPAEFLERRGES